MHANVVGVLAMPQMHSPAQICNKGITLSVDQAPNRIKQRHEACVSTQRNWDWGRFLWVHNEVVSSTHPLALWRGRNVRANDLWIASSISRTFTIALRWQDTRDDLSIMKIMC